MSQEESPGPAVGSMSTY